MHRDRFPTTNIAILCQQSAALGKASVELRAHARELQAEARAIVEAAQCAADESALLIRGVRAGREATRAPLPCRA